MLPPKRLFARNYSVSARRLAFLLCRAKVEALLLLLPHRHRQVVSTRQRSVTRLCSAPAKSSTQRCAVLSICASNSQGKPAITRRLTMFNPLKLQEALSQATQMQEEVQRKLAQTVVEGSAGGGAVSATMNGKKQIL